mgnify:CR=1 FL=1
MLITVITLPRHQLYPFVKEAMSVPQIDEILEVLRDGEWHDLSEIVGKFRLHEFEVRIIMSFLAEYNFIDLDTQRQKLKLTNSALNFLQKIQRIEREAP